MPPLYLGVFLPFNRWKPGTIEVREGDGTLLFVALARGKADGKAAAAAGNPKRDPARTNGDTPTGRYAPTAVFRFDPPHETLNRAWIPIEGETGQALAAKQNGRTGLGIHAGRGEELMATYGCLRMRQSDFDEMEALIGTRPVIVTVQEATR